MIEQFETRKTLLASDTAFDEEDFSVLRVKTLLVMTRGDDPDCDMRLEFFRELTGKDFPHIKVQLDNAADRERLRDTIYRSLDVIRVYTKRPGKPPDYDSPFTIPRGGTVEDLAMQVHRDIAASLKFARVWGTNVHDGQSVGRDHQLSDQDLVELHA
ncbi:MAG TPA: TGS domain-containing protein [Planctomycetaceae bacterium]|nr:TGS domain-containing protein [Planctomycetaceae bacterium]